MGVKSENGESSSPTYDDIGSCNIISENDEPCSHDASSNFRKLDDELVLKLAFDNVDEAEHFIRSYGKELGFDVRRHSIKTQNGLVINRVWVCAREGFRKEFDKNFGLKRERKVDKRCGCKALFRVALDRTSGKYNVTTFQAHHNHDLATKDNANLLRCNRQMSAADKSWLSTLTMVGIRLGQVMDLMEQMSGGVGNLKFRRKDGYNFLQTKRLKMIESGDINTGLSLLEGMKIHDKDLVFKYDIDEDGALSKLFWCDGLSRAEYELFGDVIAFDSTYKTNKYLFPLVIFSGVNNHFSTCVFGVALMYNETIDSYRWLLQTFREAMNGKIPRAALTDQDEAMRTAIRLEFPGARHRLCGWHIARNARTKKGLHPKFVNEFTKLLKRHQTVDLICVQ